MTLAALQSDVSRSPREGMKEVKQLVTFRIGQEDFGVDILMVQEIIRLTKITPIPNAPDFVLGVINLRGRVIPVLDLRQRLKITGNKPGADDKRTRILVVEMFAHVMGFIVDAVSEVTKVPVSAIEPTPNLVVSTVDAEYIKGMIKLSNRLIILLDFRRILKPQEEKELSDFEVDAMPGELQ